MSTENPTEELVLRDQMAVLCCEMLERLSLLNTLSAFGHRGVAFYDSARDDEVFNLRSFPSVASALAELPYLSELYGIEAGTRFTLQFVYEYLAKASTLSLEVYIFESLWNDFWTELSAREWKYIAVANIYNFECNSGLVELENNVTIRLRSSEYLMPILGEWGVRRVLEEFDGTKYGRFVIVAEHKVQKTPKNIVQFHSFNCLEKIHESLLALRLNRDGDLRIGRVFFSRDVKFALTSHEGNSSSWKVSDPIGCEYQFEEADICQVQSLLALLQKRFLSGKSSKKIDVALRAFISYYGRDRREDQLVDAITAIEALFGESGETTFKVAFRTSAFLEREYQQMSNLFSLVKSFYDTRSHLVHGNVAAKREADKHYNNVDNVDQIFSVSRKLIVAFIQMHESGLYDVDDKFLKGLDLRLVDPKEKENLRLAAKLS